MEGAADAEVAEIVTTVLRGMGVESNMIRASEMRRSAAETGELWVLEANTSGWTWHFSSPTGLRLQQTFGLDFDAQFGGLRRAAEILVEQTRRRAR